MRRHPTTYPGVVYRLVDRIGGPGKERVYYIRFKAGGKIVEEKVGRQYADRMTPAKAARIRADRIEGRMRSRKELRKEAKTKPEKWTISRLWAHYKETHQSLKGIKTDTSRFRRHLEQDFGEKLPSEICPLDISRLRIRLSRERSAATARHALELLRRITNHGVSFKLVEPMKFKIRLPSLNNEKTEDLTPEELQRLLAALEASPDRDAADLMRLALYTGMRRGEILRLAWDDVDFERGFLRIRDPKGGRDQTIPLSSAARRVLEERPRRAGSPWVFPGRRPGTRLQYPKAGVNRIREAAGLPKGFRPLHGLRHVFASTLASSGEVDMYTLQKLLTHKSPAMTQRYAHLRDEALRRAAEKAAELVHRAGRQTAEENGALSR